MNIEKPQDLAIKFRDVADSAFGQGYPFNNFPHAIVPGYPVHWLAYQQASPRDTFYFIISNPMVASKLFRI